MLRRIADAWWTLIRGSAPERRYHAEIARIRAQWTTLLIEISDLLERLEKIDGRIRKRTERAKKKAQEPTQLEIPPPPRDRKAALRARARAKGLHPAFGPAENGADGANEDEEG